jgi:hypothetical protein
MRTITSPDYRSRRPILRCLLAAYLACSVGGDRLLGLAHLAFSDHRHAFCVEHGSFEDLPKLNDHAAKPASDQGPRAAGAGDLASPFAAHSACLFLNGRTFQAHIDLANQEPAVTPEQRALEQACPSHDGAVVGTLLLSAPKTSPPFVAT